MVTLVKEYGLQYLLAATLLTGLLQILAGLLKLGSLMRFVSRSVVTGFVNALAILIFMVRLPELTRHGYDVRTLCEQFDARWLREVPHGLLVRLQRSLACLVMRPGRWPSGNCCTNSRATNLHLNKCYSTNIACVSLQGRVVLTRVIAMTAIGDNHVQIFKFSALILLASAVLAGCSSTPVAQTSAKSTETPAVVPMLTPATSSAPKPVVSSVTLPPHLDPKSPISTERSIYFDFDVFTIKPDSLKLVEQHGNYLLSKPALSIRIEGNADERGNSEYNLALGQKRAQAVLQALKTYGVKDSQMEAVSWGKERPKATGHDESAWKENRRADLVYPKQ